MLDLFFSCSTLEEPQHLQFYAQKPSNGLEGTRNADEDENTAESQFFNHIEVDKN